MKSRGIEARLRREHADGARAVVDLETELAGIVEQQLAVAPDDEHDAEGATIGFERARVAALLAHARAVLAELEEAQSRLTAGTYGRCSTCGGTIGEERLAARPTASTCVRCASAPSGLRRD